MSSLSTHPVFKNADPEQLRELERASTQRDYHTKTRILSEGEAASFVYALQTGAVRIFHRAETGEEVLLKLLRAPAIFGEAEALSGLRHVENVEAVEPSTLLAMPVVPLARFLRQDGETALRFLMDVSARLAIAAYNEKSLAFFPSTIRLANYLLDYAMWFEQPDPHDYEIPLTQDQMALAVGVTRRSVAKDMIEWQKEGILEKRQGRYFLLDLQALSRYADDFRLGLAYSLDELFERLDSVE